MRLLLVSFPLAASFEVAPPGRAIAIDAQGAPVVVVSQAPAAPIHHAEVSQKPSPAAAAPLDHWPTAHEVEQSEPLLPPELARKGQIEPETPTEPLFRKEVPDRGPEASPKTRPSFLARHATDLLILTSAAFLFPAHHAGRKGLTWISFLFAVQAVICGIYHYCDQHRVGTSLEGPVCSDATYRVTHISDHGMAYFVMLQMGLLILGPEDPTLQRIIPNCCGTSTDVAGLPLHVVALTRALPSLLVAFLLISTARGDHSIGSPAFHIALGVLVCVLLFSAKGVFWLLRPSAAAKAFALPQSWLRLALCAAAVIASIFLFLGMQMVANDDTKVGMGGAKACAHSMWHVAAALLAGLVIETLHSSRFAYVEEDFQGLLSISKDRPQTSPR